MRALSGDFRVPKREVWSDVRLAGASPLRVRLFLAERAYTPNESERPSDLLNGNVTFIPSVDESGATLVLRRDAILTVSVAASEEATEDDPLAAGTEEVTRLGVELVFDTGGTVRGVVAFLQPEARRRLGDFLNDCPQFFCLRDGDRVHVVNKARVVQARTVVAPT